MAEFTNVLVTDTFDQWRIKTNNIGADVTALIGTVETDLDGFRTEIGNTISAFETELDTTLSSYVTLATDQTITGAKTFTNGCEIGQTIFGDYIATDNTTINSRIELGYNQTSTKHQSYIDFHSDDSDADFASRIGRWNDGRFEILNKGTGALHLNTSVGTTIGANIELYGDSATTGTKNNIYYDATNHYFRDKNGANSGLTVNSTGISTTKLTINSGKMKLNNLDYTWPSSRSGGRYLRTDANGILSWEAVAGGTGDVNVSTLVFNDIVPVGTIMPWAGASEPTDGKWKFCDGEEVLKTAYPELTTILGGNLPKYGTAATGYIKLPNLEQKVPVGAGGAFNLGNTGGGISSSINGSTGSVTLTASQSGLPSHKHNINTGATFNTRDDAPNRTVELITASERGTAASEHSGTNLLNTLGNYIANAGGTSASQSHSHSLSAGSVSTLQPYLVTKYIIKVLPDDVQQVSIEAGDGINVKDANNSDTDTLDLFSTKIELKTDTTQFGFNGAGQLQLVTPAVSQATITTQIGNAVTGLATTSYVDTSYSGAFFRNITSISKFDQVANTEYEYDVTSTAFGSLTAERVTGIHVMCYTRSDNGETGGAVISTNLGGNTAFDPIKSQYDYEDAGSGAMVFIPMTQTQAKFKLKMSRTGNDGERYRKGWVIRGVSYVENI